uniref:ORF171 n=2 Tax=Cyanidiaceae TaxID=265316 RepID=A0A7G5VUU1_9RHOD|nr:ORF171 [Cyanidiococcus yangmingshanensis]QMX77458.1 ORF171 [Cyanidiococcus yangmingshanensis]UNJ16073.1 hypothetical protein [Cyanidioschyzonaceae sp. 3]WDB00434.1 hypothetical protein CCYA8123_122 [Cyanidiococcus yangmingshanensis]BAA22826.1 unnamed protein product [Cyanidium caldarium]
MDDYYIFEYRLSEPQPTVWQSLWQWYVSPVQIQHLLLSRQVQSIHLPFIKSKSCGVIDYQFHYQFKSNHPKIHDAFRQSLEACPIYYVVNPKQELILLSPRKWESEYQAPTFMNWVLDCVFRQSPTSYLLVFFHPDDAQMYLQSVLNNPYERDKNSFVQEGDLFTFLKFNRADVKVLLVPHLKQMCQWQQFDGTPVFRVQVKDREWLFLSKQNAQQFVKRMKKLSCKCDVVSLESILEADANRQARCVLVPLS